MALLPGCSKTRTIMYDDVYFEGRHVAYDQKPEIHPEFLFPDTDDPYLIELRRHYPLDSLLEGAQSDQERVRRILNWTHQRWSHNGRQDPQGRDAISILKEAEAGGQFPCFAYAIVLRDQLLAHGMPARTLYLKTEDAARANYPPGHVATEVYLPDRKEWIFVDPQFNAMPTWNGQAMNAVKFRQLITEQNDLLDFESLSDLVTPGQYFGFVYPYLFYLDTALDNRYNQPDTPAGQKTNVMLVPLNEPPLKHIRFWDMDIDYCEYTHSIVDFYPMLD